MRRQAAANSKAIATKAQQAEGARRVAERTRQAKAEKKTKQAKAAEKAEYLARLGITAGIKGPLPNPLQKLTALPTPKLLLVPGDSLCAPLQPSPTSLALGTLTLVANTDEQQTPNTNTTQPPPDAETLPDATATTPLTPRYNKPH
jgi:hypothetical protein